jgi:hypothetical protein
MRRLQARAQCTKTMLLSRVRTLNGRLEKIGLAIKQGSGTPDLLPLIVGARQALNSLG